MKKILLIEDDANIRKLVSVNLTARGYTVIEAENGYKGLARLRAEIPAVLLLDIKLPDISGWDLLRIVDDDRTYPRVPVIVITASLGSAWPEHRLYNELRRVLIKPLDLQELTSEVEAALS